MSPVYKGAFMFITPDQFVLSQIERFTQSLQRNFGIKISSVTSFFCAIILTCVFSEWYFNGIPTSLLLVLDIDFIAVILWYMIFVAKKHQAAAEKWAIQGISNPLKVSIFFVIFRSMYIGITILILVLLATSITNIMNLITILKTVCFGIYIYTACVDVLPPGNSKAGNWLKNLFKKVSLST